MITFCRPIDIIYIVTLYTFQHQWSFLFDYLTFNHSDFIIIMLTLHYNTTNGYPSNGAENGNGTYLDYTTLTNMSTERLNESKSPLVGHSMEGGSSSGADSATYAYFENLDSSSGGGGVNYGHSPLAAYSQMAGTVAKSPNYEYSIQSASQVAPTADAYSTSADGALGSLLPPMHQQISVTIGPGTSQQRTLPVIYDQMQMSKSRFNLKVLLNSPKN